MPIIALDQDHHDDIQERDKAQKGVISFEQLVEIFRIYEVKSPS